MRESNFVPTSGIDTRSRHFIYKCPVRQGDFGICVVDYQGRHYTSPGWMEGGTYECTFTNGSGEVAISSYSQGGLSSTTLLHEAGLDMLKSGEHFVATPLPGRRFMAEYDWLPLGNHDRGYGYGYVDRYRNGVLETDTVTDEEYARWEANCDLLFGSPGAHALAVRAAKARHKKQVAVKRRRDQKRGYHTWSDPWGRIVRVPID